MNQDEEYTAMATKLRDAVDTGTLEHATRATLTGYSLWLAQRGANHYFDNPAEFDQICELVRLHLLRAFMEGMEKRNSVMQYWVVALALAALFSSGVQIWYAYRADIRTQAAPVAASASSQTSPSK